MQNSIIVHVIISTNHSMSVDRVRLEPWNCYFRFPRNYLPNIEAVTVDILCTGHRENFKWLQTTSSGFHLDTIDKHVVIGGYDGKAAAVHNYNIGRIQYDGIVQIGIVDTLGPENIKASSVIIPV
ncbi:hypothetical protein BDFB_008833 [Asbolus verrucosus]|uniref:Uncharacterized protein n=1 Tax=Asbolus verrucosus TaxID=1661398 RepID=A0A482V1Q2_ASBVE|nr:hypothetical protein BDFB_008833 [Asbolus verrucosus]